MTISITSDTAIVNQALARLSEESIYSIDDDYKRARIAKRLYNHSLNYVLAYNWPFARRIKSLNEISSVDEDDKLFTYVHQVPSDSHHIIDLLPLGRKDKWEQIGNQIHSHLASPRVLYITREISVVNFSGPFINSVVTYLAALLCGPIVKDEQLTQQLMNEFRLTLYENLKLDAMIGSRHLDTDMDPDNDSFVTGEDNQTQDEDEISKRYLLPE